MFCRKIALFLIYFQLFFCSVSFASGDDDEKKPSLHVLIATTGRSTLLKMLDSIENQVESIDYITVIFDAIDDDRVYEMAAEKLAKFVCTSTIYMEPVNLGYWGHGIRNKYNELSGDFILHADDDDIYVPGALSLIRRVVSQDLKALYIFQIADGDKIISGKPFKRANISTQSGAIPSCYNSQSFWVYKYGGDFDFYQHLRYLVPKVIHVDHVIYRFRP